MTREWSERKLSLVLALHSTREPPYVRLQPVCIVLHFFEHVGFEKNIERLEYWHHDTVRRSVLQCLR